jgi:hypothetical protein
MSVRSCEPSFDIDVECSYDQNVTSKGAMTARMPLLHAGPWRSRDLPN